MTPETLARTPLHALHLELGARMVPFAGYEMPVQYPPGILKEHLHCRDQAGLFDVSHMGQIVLRGAGAAAALESLVPVDILDLPVGLQRYALFTDDNGGILLNFPNAPNAFEGNTAAVVVPLRSSSSMKYSEASRAYAESAKRASAGNVCRSSQSSRLSLWLAMTSVCALCTCASTNPGISSLPR